MASTNTAEKITQAVILAGGLGTRLRSVVSDRPKVLAAVADKPFLSWLMDLLIDSGIEKVVLSVGYCADQIIQTYGDKYKSLQISYSVEDSPAGTGGGVCRASKLITSDQFFIFNGDSLNDVNLRDFSRAYFESGFPNSICLTKVNDVARYGAVKTSPDGKIEEFVEKGPGGPGYINAGIYIISKKSLAAIRHPEPFSIEREIFPHLMAEGILGYQNDGSFIDIGTPESYAEAASFLVRWQVGRNQSRIGDI